MSNRGLSLPAVCGMQPCTLSEPSVASAEAIESYRPSRRASLENDPPGRAAPQQPKSRHVHREERRVLHPLYDDSSDGYSSHPSIYEAELAGSDDDSSSEGWPSAEHSSTGSPTYSQRASEYLSHILDSQPVGSGEGFSRRHFSSFSRVSMLGTIAEQKSKEDKQTVIAEQEDHETMQGDHDDDFESFVYDYASPVQPMHAPVVIPPLPSGSNFGQLDSRVMSGPGMNYLSLLDPVPRQPVFRPSQSGHRSYGTLLQHPFHHVPAASLHLDSGDGAEDAPTPDELPSPLARSRTPSIHSDHRTAQHKFWEKVLRGVCLACCCVRVRDSEDHSSH